jgi:hypothetical protein
MPAHLVMKVIGGERGIVNCGDLVDWAWWRRSEALRHGGAVARRICRELRDAERFWLGPGRRVSGRSATPFSGALRDIRSHRGCVR